MNKIAINIYAWVFLQAYFFNYPGRIPRIATTDKCVFYQLLKKMSSRFLLYVPFYILTSHVWEFNTWYCLFNFSHPSGWVMTFSHSFNLHFPYNWSCMSIFTCTYWVFVYLLCEVSVQRFCPFVIGLFVLLNYAFQYVLKSSPLPNMHIVNVFSQSVACLFICLIVSFE